MATVPTGLQSCVKVLQMHISGGGGTACLQRKSNLSLQLASLDVFKFLAAGFGFKAFHYSGHFAHRVANLCKVAANAVSRGVGGHLGCNPKVTKVLK